MPAIKYFYILIICSFTVNFASAQNEENTRILSNIEIFENAQKKSYRIIEDNIILLGNEKIYYFRTDAAAGISDFFINGIRKYLVNYKIITADSGKSDFSVYIKDVKLRVNYTKIKSDIFLNRKYSRKVISAFGISFLDRANSEVYSGSINESFEDTLKYEDIGYAELSGYSFTKGEIQEESLFEKLLIPGIIVISSALAVILFFIIRSK